MWKWTTTGTYTASAAYVVCFVGLEFFPCGMLIWKTWALAKCKLHIWLVVRRRIWTADRMHRHGMESHTTCPLCDQEDETTDHIATGCVFARDVWFPALSSCGMAHLVPLHAPGLIDWWPDSRAVLPILARKGFDSIVLLVVWMLWKELNRRVFERAAVDSRELCSRIASEARLWKLSGAAGLVHIQR